MEKQYIRLPNGSKLDVYVYTINTEETIIQFIDKEFNDIKEFFGNEIIDYLDVVNEDNTRLDTYNVYQKVVSIACTTELITEYETRLVKEAYEEIVTELNANSDALIERPILHDAEYQDVPKNRMANVITVRLAKPSIREEVENIKSVVGIVNTNSMTLDKFRNYYKEQVGKQCTAAIENGLTIETSLGAQHFSYTIEDQSNIKDLIITAGLTNFTLPLPYHADGELCTLYPAADILKIYMALSSNKTYHTTYCNVLNAMITDAKDIDSIKKITYGMEIMDENYIDIINTITASKDALLTAIEKKMEVLISESSSK